MRMPRLRFTLRWMMIAVVAVALAIFGEQTRRRWSDHWMRCEAYGDVARDYRYSSEHPQLYLCGMVDRSKYDFDKMRREEAERDRRRAEYYEALRDKYAAAMRLPWLAVEPDLPEPE